ncbi:hypothetical protein GcM1_248171 [Golovinomyces cichoracearum]|uniref:Integrase catalytic domain-containing protein n=1 Tax=Golovinomyces cichoracearum TaxID=62708 RepID=A0A420ID27_9PEZI|nr:hypothetical protein GcM1_248171 [Golovinomyces cichoracearum]
MTSESLASPTSTTLHRTRDAPFSGEYKRKKKPAGSIKGKDFTSNDSDSDKEQTQRFEVTRASTKELATFIKAQYDVWKSEESFLAYELWATYTEIIKPEYLEQWTKPNSSNRGMLSQLRGILRNRGVWVDNEAKQDTALFNCAQERIRGQWSSNEIDLIKESGGTPTFGMLLRGKKSQSQAQTCDQIDSNEKKLPQSQSSSESKGLQQSTNQQFRRQYLTISPQIIGVQALTNLANLYSEPMKYTGEQDSFKCNVKIFEEKCSHAGISDDQGKVKADSTMLTGDSLSYFYTHPLCSSFAAICSAMTNHFKGPESKVNAVNKWNSLNLLTRISSDPQKTTAENLEAFVSELRKLQYKLPSDLLTEQFLHMKLMTACREVPACVLACYKPAPNLPTFINDIRNSTDRRFRSSNENRSKNDPDETYVESRLLEFTLAATPKRIQAVITVKASVWERFHKGADQYFAEYDNYLKSIDETEEDDANPVEHNKIYENLILDVKSPKNDATHQERDGLSHDSDDQFFANTASDGEIFQELANNSFLRSISHGASTIWSIKETYSDPVLDNTNHNDANRSTVGYNQYIAFKNLFGVDIDPSPKFKVNIWFGIGTTTTIGAIHVENPIGLVDFYVAQTDTPFLLSHADLDNLKVYFNSVDDILVSTKSKKKWPVITLHGHAWLLWDAPFVSFICESSTSNPSFLSDTELRHLYKRLGHPSVERLHKLLESSNHEVDKVALGRLTGYCSHCQKHGKSPGRFRFTLRDDFQFKYVILVDVMYIGINPVLHVIDEYTRFQAARWLQNVSAKHTWDQLRSCWIDTYLGPPDLITHDTGKNFVSQEFRQYAHDLGTTTKVIPVEAHWSIELDKDMQLQMAVKAINDTAGPNALVPTLLVFGAYPRMTNLDAPAPTVALRIITLKKAQAEIKKVRAEKLIASSLNHRNDPSSTAIHDLPLDSDVYVFRKGNGQKIGTWQGPYKLIALDNDNAIININSYPTSFRTTALRSYLVGPLYHPASPPVANDLSSSTEKSDHLNHSLNSCHNPPELAIPFKRTRGRPRKYPLQAGERHLIAQSQEESFAYNIDCDERFKFEEIEILSYQT